MNSNNLPFTSKTEYGITGPFHVGDNPPISFDQRMVWRDLFYSNFNICLPDDKPVIFLLEDEVTFTGQIVYALNRLADNFTVIAKFINLSSRYRSKLSQKVIIYPENNYAPNLGRFCADYIVCGFNSGSFVTSIMLGQKVIPYYSKILINKTEHKIAKSFIDVVGHYKATTEPGFKSLLFKNWPYFFNIIDIGSINQAIVGLEYDRWYAANINQIRAAIFGEYWIKNAAKRASELILRFAMHGTVRKDAYAVRLK